MIARHECCVERKRMSGNHGVEISHRPSLAFERGPKPAVLLRGIGIPRQDLHA